MIPPSDDNNKRNAEKGIENNQDRTQPKNWFENWQWTSHELKKALDVWQDLSDKKLSPSPDEKMLQDMKKLLDEIKAKMEGFEETPPRS